MFYYGLHKKAGKSHELLCLPHCHRALAINNNISICQIALLILFSLCTFRLLSPLSVSLTLCFLRAKHIFRVVKEPRILRITFSSYAQSVLSLAWAFVCCIVIGHVISLSTTSVPVCLCVYVNCLCVFTICVCVENVKLVLCQGCCKLPL